jgi:hypothetical protein
MSAAIPRVGLGDTQSFKLYQLAASPGQGFLATGFQGLFVGLGDLAPMFSYFDFSCYCLCD